MFEFLIDELLMLPFCLFLDASLLKPDFSTLRALGIYVDSGILCSSWLCILSHVIIDFAKVNPIKFFQSERLLNY
jgi:hypothetical protein